MKLLNRIGLLKKLSLLLILGIQYLPAQWINQTTPIDDDLLSIQFVDKHHGWAVSASSIIATTDGGTNWVIQNLPDNNFTIEKIQFVNTKTGYVIGHNGVILKSNDGGANWEIIDTEFTYNLSDLDFINDSTGWVTGWEETNLRTGVILHTTDGGSTWEKQIEESCNCLFGSTIFMAVDFLDDSIGWALGGDYADNFSETYVYYTNSSGEEWNIIGVWESGPLDNLEVISQDTLWASGYPLIVSFDGGQNWTYPGLANSEFEIYANSIAPLNGLKGWAVHLNPLQKKYGIYYTSDMGENWNEEISFDESYATTITKVVENNLWIAGKDGLIMTRDIINSVENSVGIQFDFQLNQNYPNPFNPSTTIKFTIPNVGDAYHASRNTKLKVYDTLGREIKTLLNKPMQPGSYEVEFNGSNLTSGIYLYVLENGGKRVSKKMLLIK